MSERYEHDPDYSGKSEVYGGLIPEKWREFKNWVKGKRYVGKHALQASAVEPGERIEMTIPDPRRQEQAEVGGFVVPSNEALGNIHTQASNAALRAVTGEHPMVSKESDEPYVARHSDEQTGGHITSVEEALALRQARRPELRPAPKAETIDTPQ